MWFSRGEAENWRQLLSRPSVWRGSLLAIGLLAMAVAATVTWISPHFPRDHDEFCNLLAADTILHGRLANPTPSVWEPLQTYHVIFEPAYASKYPLGYGLLIALGWSLLGTPIAASWLAAALATTSAVWMLAAVVNRRWALLIGLLVALHPVMQVTWSQSLFGGWLTLTGAVLLTGGVLRLRRRITAHAASIAGVGIAVLALSRPFEGVIFTLLSALLLWLSWRKPWTDRLKQSCQCAAFASAPIAVSFGLIAAQNLSATGSVLQMPYQVHEANYASAPLFVFGQQKAPLRLASGQMPEAVENYHTGWSLESFSTRQGFVGWMRGFASSLWMVTGYWGFSLALIPLALSPFVLRHRLGQGLLLAGCLQLFASASVCWIFPHYLAPVLAWLLVFAAVGLRSLFALLRKRGFEHNQRAVQALLALQVGLLCIAVVRFAQAPDNGWARHRAEVQDWLEEQPGPHLVIVQYGSEHNVHQEWVYNRADLDSAKIIWARGERAAWIEALEGKYGATHKIWTLNPDLQELPVFQKNLRFVHLPSVQKPQAALD